jgi:predicted acylesterase/phospholipase RssA
VISSGKIDVTQTKYLSFEGGGGKGMLYMGVVKTLELSYKSWFKSSPKHMPYKVDAAQFKDELFPLFPIHKCTNLEKRPLKGISGASAGAITTYVLAMGMTSTEVKAEFDKTFPRPIPLLNLNDFVISQFETFFEDPDFNSLPWVIDTEAEGALKAPRHDFVISTRDAYDRLGEMLETGVDDYVRIAEEYLGTLWPFTASESIEKLKKEITSGVTRKILMKLLYKYGIVGLRSTDKGYANYPILKLLSTDQFDTSSDDEDTFTKNISETNTLKYLAQAIFQYGVFNGYAVREFFARLMHQQLYDKAKDVLFDETKDAGTWPLLKKQPEEITFRDFFQMTGVDMVIAGTNVTHAEPRYFSLFHTPDFPVIDAVAISMNIPFVFKPVYVNHAVKKTPWGVGVEPTDPRMHYTGLYIDGGLLNNLPFHAYDTTYKVQADYLKNKVPVEISIQSPGSAKDLAFYRKDITAFMIDIEMPFGPFLKKLVNFDPDGRIDGDTTNADGTEKKVGVPILNFFSGIFGTLMFPLSEYQVRTEKQREVIVVLNSEMIGDDGEKVTIDLLDFASPDVLEQRGNQNDKDRATAFKKIINAASATVIASLQNNIPKIEDANVYEIE